MKNSLLLANTTSGHLQLVKALNAYTHYHILETQCFAKEPQVANQNC